MKHIAHHFLILSFDIRPCYTLNQHNLKNKYSDETGTLKDLTWVVGAAVVTALIIVGATLLANILLNSPQFALKQHAFQKTD
ncbi:Uncharacterized [Moorella glycerini]|uniref:Uncharacterized protein n=1 Tax=Neomoorella stamsii TaxID=1266720 RepID=A0A9X7J1G7_9FIRM|nr:MULTISPECIES: hypothetical protein [Moorella]PRR71553.1 hypothetical protein MOST_23910 [Moorella stamsii]CEP66586.1 Uncharacterized [Moorella glycerini]